MQPLECLTNCYAATSIMMIDTNAYYAIVSAYPAYSLLSYSHLNVPSKFDDYVIDNTMWG